MLRAQTSVQVYIVNFQNQSLTNRPCQIQYLSYPGVGNGVVGGDIYTVNSDQNGMVALTNPVQGVYRFTITAPPQRTEFMFLVTNIQGNVNVTNLLVASADATFPVAAVAWAASVTDGRYAPIGSINGNNILNATNVTGTTPMLVLVTNGSGSVTISNVVVSPTNFYVQNFYSSNFITTNLTVTSNIYTEAIYVTNIEIFGALTNTQATPNTYAYWNGQQVLTNTLNGGSWTNLQFADVVTGNNSTGLIVSNSAGALVLVASPPGGSVFSPLWFYTNNGVVTPVNTPLTNNEAATVTFQQNIVALSAILATGGVTATAGFSGPGVGITTFNADNITQGTVPVARLPLATSSTPGVVQPDNATTFVNGSGILSAVGSGGGAAYFYPPQFFTNANSPAQIQLVNTPITNGQVSAFALLGNLNANIGYFTSDTITNRSTWLPNGAQIGATSTNQQFTSPNGWFYFGTSFPSTNGTIVASNLFLGGTLSASNLAITGTLTVGGISNTFMTNIPSMNVTDLVLNVANNSTTGLIVSNSVVSGLGTLVLVPSPSGGGGSTFYAYQNVNNPVVVVTLGTNASGQITVTNKPTWNDSAAFLGTNDSVGADIGSGFNNVVIAGSNNVLQGTSSAILAGIANTFTEEGYSYIISSDITGGATNLIESVGTAAPEPIGASGIFAGMLNTIETDPTSTTGGGNLQAVILGGVSNTIKEAWFTGGVPAQKGVAMVGGVNNTITDSTQGMTGSVLLGGYQNQITDSKNAAIVGGQGNTNNGSGGVASAILGGAFNYLDAWNSAQIGGELNLVSAWNSAIIAGQSNGLGNLLVSGSTVAGPTNSVIIGGTSNYIGTNGTRGANNSVAMGVRAWTTNQQTFVFSDGTTATFAPTADDQFVAQASGGFNFVGPMTNTGNLIVTGNIGGSANSILTMSNITALNGFFGTINLSNAIPSATNLNATVANMYDGAGNQGTSSSANTFTNFILNAAYNYWRITYTNALGLCFSNTVGLGSASPTNPVTIIVDIIPTNNALSGLKQLPISFNGSPSINDGYSGMNIALAGTLGNQLQAQIWRFVFTYTGSGTPTPTNCQIMCEPVNGTTMTYQGSQGSLSLTPPGMTFVSSGITAEITNAGGDFDIFATLGNVEVQSGSLSMNMHSGKIEFTGNVDILTALIGETGPSISAFNNGSFQGTLLASNGFASAITNVLQAGSANSWSGQFSTINSGWTNTWGTNAIANITATTANVIFYDRGGTGGGSAAANPIWTNTITGGETFPVGSGCGFQITSSTGPTVVVYGQ